MRAAWDPATEVVSHAWQQLAIVTNTAAFIAVDKAEPMPRETIAHIAYGAELLASAYARHGVQTMSTDCVFESSLTGVYEESDPIGSIDVLGRNPGTTAVYATLARPERFRFDRGRIEATQGIESVRWHDGLDQMRFEFRPTASVKSLGVRGVAS